MSKFSATILVSIALIGLALFSSLQAQAESRQLEIKIQGGKATYVPLEKAGLPKQSLPGVKFITSDMMSQMKGPTESGVFMIDAQAVPRNMAALLKQAKYNFSSDGTLTDSKGEKIALFAHSLTYLLEKTDKQTQVPGLLERFADTSLSFLIPSARAGDPYPFMCFTTEIWAVYQVRDFHRWQQAHTFAEANGATAAGDCGPSRPDTAINSIQVEAGFTNRPSASAISRRSCRTCTRSSVWRQHDFGYFWPAIGSTRTNVHRINMYDPSGRRRYDFYVEWMHRP